MQFNKANGGGINYALGYHQRWEVWLHEARRAAAEALKPLTPPEEVRLLEAWLTENKKRATEITLCSVCNELIAEALLTGKDPFECPQTARDDIKEAIKKFGRRKI
jgi:hypothetical protein